MFFMSVPRLLKLSEPELQFIEEGIAQNVRIDGRGRLDYRPFVLETGLFSQTNGSARLKLDTTDIVVGVKVEVGEPDPVTPKWGRLQFNVECAPSVSPEFEGRGGDELNLDLTRIIERIFVSKDAIDLSKLCIYPGQKCWVLFVDVMVMEYGGNLIDAIAMCIRAALRSTRIPKVTVEEGKKVGMYELHVSDDPEDCFTLAVDNVPITVTLTQIGQSYVVDTTAEEECLQNSSKIVFAINKKGNLCMIDMNGGFVEPHILKLMIKNAIQIGFELLKKMDEILKTEENDTTNSQLQFFHESK